MATINEKMTETGRHCAHCGLAVTDEVPAIERFGERFCSEAHAEEFTADVRKARIQAAARVETASTSCGLSSSAPRTGKDYLKRAACWGAPVLVILAIPLFWSGSAAAATGVSILSALALLACPLGMYFMMRAMGNMSHGGQSQAKDAEDHDAQRH
jgi:hypothetical protein